MRSLEEARKNSIVISSVEQSIVKANSNVSRAESIRKFEIVPDAFTQENGLVTPSLKAKRNAVIERYNDLIENKIYSPRPRK